MTTLNNLFSQFSGVSYGEAQQQLALQALQLTVQGTQEALRQQSIDAQLSQVSANQSLVNSLLLAQDAIKAGEKQIEVTREIQEYQNTQYDRQYLGLAQNIISYKKAIRSDLETGDKIGAQRAGSAKASAAASGIVASEGSARDYVNSTIVESQKDTMNTFTNSYNRVLQTQEDMLGIKAQQIMSNFTTDTQVNFNIEELNRRLRFI